MWIRNLETDVLGWHVPQESDVRTLLVYVKKSSAWIVQFWNVEKTECVELDEPGPF